MRSLTSISLIIIFLAGIVGVNYDSHFCGGKMVESSLSFVTHELSCGMIGMDDHFDHHHSPQKEFRKICCENEHLGYQIDNDYKDFQPQDIQFEYVAIIPLFSSDYEFSLDAQKRYEFLGYSPPPVCEDIIIFNQTFLI